MGEELSNTAEDHENADCEIRYATVVFARVVSEAAHAVVVIGGWERTRCLRAPWFAVTARFAGVVDWTIGFVSICMEGGVVCVCEM